MSESSKIIGKLRSLLEDEENLSIETCYFLTKELNEQYWEMIQESDDLVNSDVSLDDDFEDEGDGIVEDEETTEELEKPKTKKTNPAT